jgi:hypothetical protein
MTETVQILEFVTSAGTKPRVDREKGILFDVKFLGEESANPFPKNNVYSRKTREAAIPILEGSRVNINHAKKGEEGQTRDYEAGFGVARNLTEKGDGLYGDCHFNPKHRIAEQVCWDAENCPENMGFSICAHGKGQRVGRTGKFAVESIVSRESIDLVSRPATTHGLYESRNHMTTTTIKALRESLKSKPDTRVYRLLKEVEDAGMADMPLPAEPALSTDEAGIEAMCSMIKAAAAENDWDKAKKILVAFQKMLDEKPAKPAEETPETPAEEGRKPAAADPALASLQEELRQAREEQKVRDLIEDAGLAFAKPEARRVFVKSLIPLTEADRKALIDERKTPPGYRSPAGTRSATPGVKPNGTTTVQESKNGQGDDKPPADPRERARWLSAK